MPLYPAPQAGSLIPFLGGLISKAAPFVGGLLGRLAPRAAPTVTRALAPIAPAVGRALAPVGRVLATPVGRAITAGGAFGAAGELVQRGFKITIDRRTGQQRLVRRRRLNPTNIRAARRALRRLRSFKRATRKVNALLMPRRILVRGGRRPRRMRGDILPFEHDGSINPYAAEDWADYVDELEDLGYDSDAFFQDDEAEAGG